MLSSRRAYSAGNLRLRGAVNCAFVFTSVYPNAVGERLALPAALPYAFCSGRAARVFKSWDCRLHIVILSERSDEGSPLIQCSAFVGMVEGGNKPSKDGSEAQCLKSVFP